nr:hypothetical protein [Pandoravirus belohorizontensis]
MAKRRTRLCLSWPDGCARACSARRGSTDRGVRARQRTPRDQFPLAWADFCRAVARRRARAPSSVCVLSLFLRSALRFALLCCIFAFSLLCSLLCSAVFLLFLSCPYGLFFSQQTTKQQKKTQQKAPTPACFGRGKNTQKEPVKKKRREPNPDRQQ